METPKDITLDQRDQETFNLLWKHYTTKCEDDLIRTCPFGSCQYTGIWNAYIFTLELLHAIGPAKTASLFRTPEGNIPKYSNDEAEHLAKLRAIIEGVNKDEVETEGEEDSILTPMPDSINEYYEITADYSWDLWAAAEGPIEEVEKIKFPDGMELTENFGHGWKLAWTTFFFETNPSLFSGYCT